MNRRKRLLRNLARRLAERRKNGFRRYESVFSTDPPEILDGLTFKFLTVRQERLVGLVDFNNPTILAGVMLAVTFVRPGSIEVIGSAVMVAPAIAMTANHNVADRLKEIAAAEQTPGCLAISFEGILQLWDVKTISYASDSDIAMLGLIPRFPLAKERMLYAVHMTTRFPNIGERVEVYGYRAVKREFLISEKYHTEMEVRCILSTGTVTALYPDKRDTVMLPWPCFEVDCAAVGGMSGGPVFDEFGHLIGILTSSLSGDKAGPSYVSLITRAFAMKFDSAWPIGLIKPQMSLLEIISPLRSIHGEDAVKLINSPDGGRSLLHNAWT